MQAKRAALLAILLLSSTIICADIIILKNGGKIVASTWWYEGDELKYQGYGGTYGIQSDEVAFILPHDSLENDESEEYLTDESRQNEQAFDEERLQELESRAADLEALTRHASIDEREKIRLKIAEIYTTIGNELFRKKSYDDALSYYFKALDQRPDFHPAKVNIASTHLVTGSNRDALPYILDALSSDPENPTLHEILGDVYYMMDDVPAALRSWERSLELEQNRNLRERVEKTRTELDLTGNYQIANGRNFTLIFDGEKYARIGDDILAFLEDNFDELMHMFNHYPLAPISVIIYPESDFYVITESPKWVGGLFDGKIRVPVKGLDSLTQKAKKMLLHELAHAFIYSKTKGNCTKWLHEGIAQRIEGKNAPVNFITRDKLESITLSSLDENLDYKVSLSIVSHIEHTYSFHTILLILDNLGKGMDIGQAIEKATGVPAEELLREWKNFIISRGVL